MMNLPGRGFPEWEFARRVSRAQTIMRERKMDFWLLTTEPDIRYFSGFLTQFWQSPTRPWFLVVPADGKPIAVIPQIGESGMRETWLDDIRVWPSPRPEDDGVTLLADTIDTLPRRYGVLGTPLAAESYLRMPVQDFSRLKELLAGVEIVDMSVDLHRLRMVKSPAEIAKVAAICDLVSACFENFPSRIHAGMSELDAVRMLKLSVLEQGADNVPYMVSGSGAGGYGSIIMGPAPRQLADGDVLMIDTGSTFDGYYCDFDRNFGFGKVDEKAHRAHRIIWDATQAGFAAARPGATTSDIWRAMHQVMAESGNSGNDVGRLGHGLGMELTERPSNTTTDNTPLQVGMVLTLEPGMTFAAGRQMVHEENIVITEDGARWLTRRAPRDMPII